VDACGENGEFHTCVVRAPLFASRIPARVAGFHDYRAPPEHGGDVFRFADLAPA
jgi:diphthamide synthase (EF-2-diphthine--ammonia ligase)